MTLDQHIDKTFNVLRSFEKKLFDPTYIEEEKPFYINRIKRSGKIPIPGDATQPSFERIVIYYPEQIPYDEPKGYRLKTGAGFISLSQTFRLKQGTNRVEDMAGFTYRFITKGTSYMGLDSKGNFNQSILYKYRYDKNFKRVVKESHPPKELHVVHSHPRFEIKGVFELKDFLKQVNSTCFKKDEDVHEQPFYPIL